MASDESSIDGRGVIKEGENGKVGKDAHILTMASPIDDPGSVSGEEITPLLIRSDIPKFNIFSVYDPRRKQEQLIRAPEEIETSTITQFILWAWNGSRYSGLLCTAISSIIYCIMGIISDVFSAQSIPLFEIAFSRCTILLLFSVVWLRRSRQPLLGPPSARKFLILRALVGYFSLMCFVYYIQRLLLSQALILNFMTPIMAAIAARIILHEKLNIADIAGLACSFIGILFISLPMFSEQDSESLEKTARASDSYIEGNNHMYAALVGLVSSISGGISYCLVRAGAKESDQPVVTVFSFAILASPAAAICAFTFQEFVLPGIHSLVLMLVLGALAFHAELFLARGLQLDKTCKVANVQFIEAALSLLWGMSSSRIVPSFGRLVGCFLIFISVCCTIYLGPEKERE